MTDSPKPGLPRWWGWLLLPLTATAGVCVWLYRGELLRGSPEEQAIGAGAVISALALGCVAVGALAVRSRRRAWRERLALKTPVGEDYEAGMHTTGIDGFVGQRYRSAIERVDDDARSRG